MSGIVFPLADRACAVVGCFGKAAELAAATRESVAGACDLVEIRLDAIAGSGASADPESWEHLRGLPLLFTARRGDEGGHGDLDAATRCALLERALEDAACIDVEVASIAECTRLLERAAGNGVPWIASFHDFGGLPPTAALEQALRRAKESGAAVFKAAAWLHSPGEMARLADFQLADHGIPVATMGMGPLAVVSRLLCAQCGSVLNYGFLGETPTAPGQWSAEMLGKTIPLLTPAAR